MKINLDLDKTIAENEIVDEPYTNTGAAAFNLAHDYFYGSTELEIWTGLLGTGTQLTENTDYTLGGVSTILTNRALENIYSTVTIDNATYQTGTIYITYHACADIIEAGDVFERLEFDTATDTTYTIRRSDPDIFAIDTTTDAFTLTLPDLATNLGRAIKIININGSNNITYQRAGSDTIGTAGTDGTVGEAETELIIATADYWNIGTDTQHSLGDGSDHANVVLNDTHRAGNGSDHANVVTNATNIGTNVTAIGTNVTAIGLNTTHRGSAGIDHADVVSNNTHRADNTQAHSDYLLNDEVDEGVGLTLTGDNSVADTAYVPMVLYNTDDTPPAASGFPHGTIYIQYTA